MSHTVVYVSEHFLKDTQQLPETSETTREEMKQNKN